MARSIPTDVYDETLPECYRNKPIVALRQSSRKKLSMFLNPERDVLVSCGVLPDYTGLAELLDFEYLEIENFRRNTSPTEAILQEWQQRPNLKPTLGKLVDCLREMEREDALTECMPSMLRDIEAFVSKQQQKMNEPPIQDNRVTSSPAPLRYYNDHHVDETKIITIQDVQEGCPQYYDAFVCYNPEGQDLAFVKEMLEVLESDSHKLRMFVPWRDDLPGSSTHTVSATLIQERCKKMVIIMSPRYLASPACDFQTKFAHSLAPGSRSKKLVPVLIRDCNIPLILRPVTLCDFTKGDLKEWFWERLAWTIKAPIDSQELEYEVDDVSDICLDVSSTSSEEPWGDPSPSSSTTFSTSPSSSAPSSSSSSGFSRSSGPFASGWSTSETIYVRYPQRNQGQLPRRSSASCVEDRTTSSSGSSRRFASLS